MKKEHAKQVRAALGVSAPFRQEVGQKDTKPQNTGLRYGVMETSAYDSYVAAYDIPVDTHEKHKDQDTSHQNHDSSHHDSSTSNQD